MFVVNRSDKSNFFPSLKSILYTKLFSEMLVDATHDRKLIVPINLREVLPQVLFWLEHIARRLFRDDTCLPFGIEEERKAQFPRHSD